MAEPPHKAGALGLDRVAERARSLTQALLRGAAGRRRARPEPPPVAAPAGAPGSPRGPLIAALERGTPLDDAVLQEVRALLAAGRAGRAQAIAESLLREPGTVTLGRLAAGVVAHHRGYAELAWARLQGLDPATWGGHAAAEHVRAGLAVAPEEALAAVRRLVDEDPAAVGAQAWYEVVTAVLGHGDQALARAAFARLDDHVERNHPAWADGPERRDRLRPLIEADAGSPAAPAPAGGRPVLAVMDSAPPGARRASSELGEDLETIAGLGHLVRHQGVRLHGRRGLVDLLGELRERTRPDRRRDDLAGELEVLRVHRDASTHQRIPEGAWVLCSGRMQPLFGVRHDFPLHRNLRPLFIGWHGTERELLTPEAIAYLRRHGPVGCRDWTTVHLLASAGVPAFFSGSLTTTIDAVFPDAPAPAPDAPPAYADLPAKRLRAGGRTNRRRPADAAGSFAGELRIALERLDAYRREHPRVVTSRLHAHLALRAIGVATTFEPAEPADPALDGLLGITDDAFEAMQAGITAKLDAVLRRIVAGASEADVYGLWRELTADEVAAAERELRRPVQLAAPKGWDARIRRAASGSVTRPRSATAPTGETVHCAVLVDKHRPRVVGALLDSLVAHSSRPLHVHVFAPPDLEARIGPSFPELNLTRIPAGPLRAHGRRLRRTLLPALLPDVERVVVLPLPSVVTTDVAELAALDLGAHALAAPVRHGTARTGRFGVVEAAGTRLGRRPPTAFELYRAALARHPVDVDAFAVDVLVMDLERLRRAGAVEEALAFAEAFDLGDLAVLNLLVGPDRATVPERWAVVPTRTAERGAGLRYWADGVKPWHGRLAPEREAWRRHALAV